MEEITLEKIDIIRERTGVTYTEAKEALEATNGNVVDALIYIEKNSKKVKDQLYTTKDEFIEWLREVIRKGNVSRIRVKKDEKVLVDIPVNAGVAAGVIMMTLPALLAIVFVTAVVAKVTVEITKEDGSVEVVNKIIENTFTNVKDKVNNATADVKEKVSDVKDKFNKDGSKNSEGNTYQYTVKFEDLEDNDK